MRIHYNFCRVHSTLQTTSEAAGLKICLNGNMVESLIRLATQEK
jgi:hypothetical protein